jgi:hypothetical protein
MTLAIAHREGDVAVLDLIAERKPPFSPESVVEEFSGLLMRYGITRIHGDRYAGEWPRERFAVHGVTYQPSEMNRSELYPAAFEFRPGRSARSLEDGQPIRSIGTSNESGWT